MKTSLRYVLILCLSLLGGWGMLTYGAPQEKTISKTISDPSHTRARLVADVKQVQAGTPFKAGVVLEMEPGWHTYYLENGDAGLPTRIQWKLPTGFQAGKLLWEKPERIEKAGIVSYGYEHQTLIASQVTPPKALSGDVPVHATVKWLSCLEECIPGQAELSLELPSTPTTPQPSPEASTFEKTGWQGKVEALVNAQEMASENTPGPARTTDISFPLCLLFAFIGGLILNVMPCVLPVIALKVVSIVEQAHGNDRLIKQHALTFTAGIICTFLLLACGIIAIQTSGGVAGWGFLFQYPAFVSAMAIVLWLSALSLFDLYHLEMPTLFGMDKLSRQNHLPGTFCKGVLATLLSTPCSAPFLGSALAFAFAQPPANILLVFFVVGLGMALPYFALILRPELLKSLPKPGAWMNILKELMGFVMIATVLWLLGILGHMVGSDGLMKTLLFMVTLTVAAWTLARFGDLRSSKAQRWRVRLLSLAIVGIGFYLSYVAEKAVSWQPYTASSLSQQLHAGKTVFLDFTADWCMTCKVNERLILENETVRAKMSALKVIPMQVDWTTQDPNITGMLKHFQRPGVPLYVIYPAKNPSNPIVLPEVITDQIVLDALDAAGPSQ